GTPPTTRSSSWSTSSSPTDRTTPTTPTTRTTRRSASSRPTVAYVPGSRLTSRSSASATFATWFATDRSRTGAGQLLDVLPELGAAFGGVGLLGGGELVDRAPPTIEPEVARGRRGLVVRHQPYQRVGPLVGRPQERPHHLAEGRQRRLDAGGVGPPGVHGVEHHLRRRHLGGPQLVHRDLGPLAPCVLLAAAVLVGAHLQIGRA